MSKNQLSDTDKLRYGDLLSFDKCLDRRFLECGFAKTLGVNGDGPVKVKMIEPIPRIGQNIIGSTEGCATD